MRDGAAALAAGSGAPPAFPTTLPCRPVLYANAMDSQTLSLLTIPLFTGAIGYVTN